MRGKSILALAVALAMIFSVIPAFGLTASAAEVGDTFQKDGAKYKIVDGTNMFTNGSFETDLTGWTSYNNGVVSLGSHWVKSEDYSKDGKSSLHVSGWTGWSGSNNADNLQTYIKIDANKKYVLRFSEYWTAAQENNNTGHMSAATVSVGYGTSNFKQAAGGWNSWENNPRTPAREANKWIDYEYILDTGNAAVSSSDDLYAVIAYSLNNCSELYLDAFELYEVEEVKPDATATVKYVDEEKTELKTVTAENLYSGDEFAYTPDEWLANDDCTAFYAPDNAGEQKITLKADTEGENVLEISCTAIDFAETDLPKGTVTVNEAEYNVVGETNLIPNPSFETKDGQYSIAGWYGGIEGQYTAVPNTYPYPKAHQYEQSDAKAGSYSFGSRWRDDARGFCTLLTNFKAEQGKTYYLSYDVKYVDDQTEADPNAKVDLGVASGKDGVAAEKTTTNISGASKTDWTTYTGIVKVDDSAENPYIYFNAYNIGNKNNGGQRAAFQFDNFILVEVEEGLQTVTVNYEYNDQVIKSEAVELNAAVKNYAVKANSIVAGTDGSLYKVTSGDPVNITEGAATIELEKLDTNVLTLQNGTILTNNLTDDAVYKGDKNFGMFNWNAEGYDRVGVAVLDVDKAVTQPALSATKVRFSQNARGGGSHNDAIKAQIYAVSLEKFAEADLSDMANVAEFFTDENLVLDLVDDDRDFFGKEFKQNETASVLFALDAEKVNAAAGESEKVVLIGTSNHTLYGYAGEGMTIVEGAAITLDGRLMATVLPSTENVEISVGNAIAAKDEDGNIYAAADGKIKIENVEKNVSLTSIADLGVALLDGAQVRIGKSTDEAIGEDSGLRFIGTVNKDGTLAGLDDAEISVEIIPADVTDPETEPLKIKITNYQDSDKSVFTAVITNLKKNNYNRVFKATPAVTVKGETYMGTPVYRSIYEVAEGLLENGADASLDEKLGDEYTVEGAIAEVLNLYVNKVGVRINLEVDGQATVDEDGYKGYVKDENPEGTAKAFFTIDGTTTKEGTAYKIVIKPIGGQVVLDENLIAENIRINNNNSKAKEFVTAVKDADGSVTITFDPAKTNG